VGEDKEEYLQLVEAGLQVGDELLGWLAGVLTAGGVEELLQLVHAFAGSTTCSSIPSSRW
jgi:hypothetical protein